MAALESDPFAAAILLAGTAAGDEAASAPSLDPALRARVDAMTEGVRTLRARARDAAVAALVAATGPNVSAADAPPRARAVVAAMLPREKVADSPAPRRGFRATAALRTTIACTDEDAWRV